MNTSGRSAILRHLRGHYKAKWKLIDKGNSNYVSPIDEDL